MWRFSTQAENFNSVKRVEKIDIMWGFSSLAEKFSSRTEFSRLFSVTVSEAAVRRCSVRQVFLKILQNLLENTCVRVSFLIKLQVSCLFKTG